MKNTIALITAVTVIVPSAFASKAQREALGGTRNIPSIQSIFSNPVNTLSYGDFVTYEAGVTSNAATASTATLAEGGFIRSYQGGAVKTGFYLGKRNSYVSDLRSAGTFQVEENPINIFWAKKLETMDFGFNLNYSKSDKTAVLGKQESTGLALGLGQGAWKAALTVGLGNKATNLAGTSSLKDKLPVIFDFNYNIDDLKVYFNYVTNTGTIENAAGVTTADLKKTDWYLALYQNQKLENGMFFYGFAYENRKWENSTAPTSTTDNVESTKLPVTVGIEAEANSWLTLRASIKQNVILGEVKTGTGEKSTVANDPTVNAGVGLRYGKATVDALLEGLSGSSASAKVNGSETLSKVSLTYMF